MNLDAKVNFQGFFLIYHANLFGVLNPVSFPLYLIRYDTPVYYILISYGNHKKDLVYFLGAYGRLEFSPLEFRLHFWIRLNKESAEINYKFYCTTKGDTSWRLGTYPDKHLFNFSILTSLKCLSYKWHTLQGVYCKLKYWKCRWLILNKLRGQDIMMS